MKKLFIKITLSICILFIFSFTSNDPPKLATFKAIKMVSYIDTTLFGDGYASLAYLYETPTIKGLTPCIGVQDGSVKLNDVVLNYNMAIKMYVDDLKRKKIDGVNWKITNSSQFENFNYTTVKAIPSFTNIAAIPKVISKSKNYVINFGTLQGVDKIEFNINNNQLYLNAPFYKKIPASANSITINKADLSNLINANQTTVNVTLIAEEEKVYNNKTYIFENRLEIVKYVTVTN